MPSHFLILYIYIYIYTHIHIYIFINIYSFRREHLLSLSLSYYCVTDNNKNVKCLSLQVARHDMQSSTFVKLFMDK